MKKTVKSLIIAVVCLIVLVAAFLAVYFLLPSQDEEADSDTLSSDSVEGTHLIAHTAAELKKIDVENESGKYTLLANTPTTETTDEDGVVSTITDSTVYTLVGYEDMELLAGSPDTLADDACSVTATKLVNDGSKKSDFGFDSPRATVTAEFTNSEKRTITLGDDAPDSKGAYIMVDGDSNVYLVESDSVDGFLISAMGMLSTEIGTAAEDDDGNIFTKMVFSGSRFDNKEVVFDYNTNDAFTETYTITSPDLTIANEETSTYMVGNVRNITADEVVAVNATAEQIAEYGLDKPYVTVEAEFKDIKPSYKATKPNDEGDFYILSNNIIYLANSTSVPWVNYSYEQLIPTDVIAPKSDSVTKITVEAGNKSYEFNITRVVSSTHDEENDTDVESTETTVTCNDKEISEGNYNAFYQNLTSAKRSGLTDKPKDKKSLLKVTFEYTNGKTSTAEYFEGENRKCTVLINETLASTAYESYVNKIIEDVAKAANDETVKSIY